MRRRGATEKIAWTLPNGEVVHFPTGYRHEVALARVAPGDALLDVGCARGALAAALLPRFESVVGVDVDEEMLAEAGGRGIRTERVDVDAEPLPFPDASFDAVLCLELVEHVADPARLVRELARVLRPRGRLYLSTPNVRFARYLWELVVRGRFPVTSSDPQGWQGGHVHFFTFADVGELLVRAGFDDVEHVGLTSARRTRSLPYRLAPRAGAARLLREFGSVGIFTIATRTTAEPLADAGDLERRFA